MRDPARIKPFLEKLEQYWLKHPDLRLGQIIENAKISQGRRYMDTFYVEDDLLEEGLDELDKDDH